MYLFFSGPLRHVSSWCKGHLHGNSVNTVLTEEEKQESGPEQMCRSIYLITEM